MKVGDLVTCKHWLEREMAVVVRCQYNDKLVEVVLTNGRTRCHYIHDLVVLNECR